MANTSGNTDRLYFLGLQSHGCVSQYPKDGWNINHMYLCSWCSLIPKFFSAFLLHEGLAWVVQAFLGDIEIQLQFSSVHSLSHVQLFANPWTSAHQASLSITKSIESVMPSNHLILGHPLPFLPSIFPSIRVFSKESVLHTSGQSIGVSASSSVLPMNIQDWFPLGLTGLISCSPRDSQESSPTSQFKSINQGLDFPDSSVGKESTCNAGDPGLIPLLQKG